MIDNQKTSSQVVDTKEVSSAALRWLDTQRSNSRWGLSDEDIRTLLGGLPPCTASALVSAAKHGEGVELSQDTIDRLSLLLDIHRALTLLAPMGKEYDMFSRPAYINPLRGQSIREYLLKNGSLGALCTIRNMLYSHL